MSTHQPTPTLVILKTLWTALKYPLLVFMAFMFVRMMIAPFFHVIKRMFNGRR